MTERLRLLSKIQKVERELLTLKEELRVLDYGPEPKRVKGKLPGACFDYCDWACVNTPFHGNCPGYDDLQ